MKDNISNLIEGLNADKSEIRLECLKKLMIKIETGEIKKPERGKDVNNHIHTTYSFSPYSPAKAIWMALNAGLETAGIMDHDSVGGVTEFIEAGRVAGIATTIGIECRVDFSDTPLAGKRINNTDQNSIAYMALHGIPHASIQMIRDFFVPYTAERNIRNKKMIKRLNDKVYSTGIVLDFEKDVVPISMSKEGGSITERHILYSLSQKLTEKFGKGSDLLSVLENKLNLVLNNKIKEYLIDPENKYYSYDLLGYLKGELLPDFYVPASKECPDVRDVLELSKKAGSISAYAYLGDVANSVTGDKKDQKFEDGYIDQLFEVLKELGFNAVTYMPSRNSRDQLKKVRGLCDKYDFLQISGEDINSPRQKFVCEAMRDESFKNLVDSTWALIGHEVEATKDPDRGMFTEYTISKYPSLTDRINLFKELAKI